MWDLQHEEEMPQLQYYNPCNLRISQILVIQKGFSFHSVIPLDCVGTMGIATRKIQL